jgi:hypothetical protein
MEPPKTEHVKDMLLAYLAVAVFTFLVLAFLGSLA